MNRARPSRLVGLAACLVVAGVLAGVGGVGLEAGWLSGLRARSSDAIVFPRGEAAPEVVVVGVDARSVTEQRQAWPWSRDTQADLVAKIAAAGARVVVVDIVLAPAGVGDDRLAAALASVPSVIGAAVEVPTGLDKQWSAIGVLLAANMIEPEQAFSSVAEVGHTAVTPDGDDGVTRRLPLVVEYDRRFRPGLALSALALSEGMAPVATVRPGAVQIGTRTIPTDERHQLRVSYAEELAGTDTSLIISATDVLNDRLSSDAMRDKVVFIGVTDPVAGDRLLTPVAKRSGMAGVLVHANAYSTMANRYYLTDASATETVAWMFALAAIVALLTVIVRLWVGVVAGAVFIAGFVLLAIGRADDGTVLDVVFPTLAILLALLASAGVRELFVDRQRRRISSLFAQYVPPRVARELVGDQRASGLLDGQRLEVTVLFCDIRGFTPVTAALSPSQIRELLDSYYTVLSQVVLDHSGTVLRYTGDEILAAFGAPIESTDHADRAVACAVAMHAARSTLAARLADSGLPPLDYGIGVQTGEVVSAVMGSAIRRQYAVIGTPLTLGSRLCSQARAGETVVAAETWGELTGEPPSAESFTTELKGRAEAAQLYRISSATSPANP